MDERYEWGVRITWKSGFTAIEARTDEASAREHLERRNRMHNSTAALVHRPIGEWAEVPTMPRDKE